jgi:hypothetical protein
VKISSDLVVTNFFSTARAIRMPLPPPLLLLPTTDCCCCCCNLRNELREEEAQLLSKNLNPDQSPAAAPAATQEAAAPPTKAAIAKRKKQQQQKFPLPLTKPVLKPLLLDRRRLLPKNKSCTQIPPPKIPPKNSVSVIPSETIPKK